MNILYFADPNSIHDIKWIDYFLEKNIATSFWLIRKHHFKKSANNKKLSFFKPIDDFSILRFPLTLVTAFRIKKIIKKYKIDIIHILYAEPNALWCNFRKYFNVPMIITCRGTDVLKTIPEAYTKKTPINRIVAPLYTRAFQMADQITGTSQKQLQSIVQFSGRVSNTNIVLTGVDFKRLLVDTQAHFPLLDDRPYILFPRYIKPIYNHEFALSTIKLLPLLVKEKYKMVFVGKNAGDMNYQETLVELMSAMGDVHFEFIKKQPQEAIFELYKRASLVVMTPHSDGSPVSAMEALTCGAPVILGPLAYDESFVEKGIYKLKKWDNKELVLKITEVLTNTNTYTSSPAKFDDFSLESNMDKMLEIYRNYYY